MMQFQKGDLVRRTGPSMSCLDTVVHGDIYRVKDDTDGEVRLEGQTASWLSYRFELAYRPTDPNSWKPAVGDYVRWDGQEISRRRGNVYRVVDSTSATRAGRVRISTDDEGSTHWPPDRWLTQLTPITTAEGEQGSKDNNNDKKESTEMLTAADELAAAKKELEDFKTKVRDAVIREAERRDWCSEADEWLEELGLEGRARTHGLPTNAYAVDRRPFEFVADEKIEVVFEGLPFSYTKL